MKKKIAKGIFLALLLALQALVVGHLLYLLVSWLQHLKIGMEFNFRNITLMESISGIFKDKDIRVIYIVSQVAIATLFLRIKFGAIGLSGAGNSKDGPKRAGSGQFGAARWMNATEIAKNIKTWISGDSNLKYGGIVFGSQSIRGKVKIWFDDKVNHILLVATTGGGKGRRIILPSIWFLAKSGESMVVSDPKGENFLTSKDYLEKMGYDVVCLNLLDTQTGDKWNIMERVNTAVDEGKTFVAINRAKEIAEAIAPKPKGGGDPIWRNGQVACIQALILAVAMDGEKKERHMYSVAKMMQQMGVVKLVKVGNQILEVIPLNNYFETLHLDHPARIAFTPALMAIAKMRSSFFTMTLSAIEVFLDPEISSVTHESSHDLKTTGLRKTAVFVVSPDYRESRNIIVSLYLDTIYKELVEFADANGGELPVRVNFLIDELANIPAIPELSKKITVARSRNVRFLLVVQDTEQIRSKYGDDGGTIMGNCNIWIYLGSNNPNTAKDLSQRMGQYTVQTESASASTSQASLKPGTVSQSQSLAGRSLLTIDEVLQWHSGEALVMISGQRPARFPISDLSDLPANSDFGLYPKTNNPQLGKFENGKIIGARRQELLDGAEHVVYSNYWTPEKAMKEEKEAETSPRTLPSAFNVESDNSTVTEAVESPVLEAFNEFDFM